MFDLILDSVEDFHTVEERRLHRIFCGLTRPGDFLFRGFCGLPEESAAEGLPNCFFSGIIFSAPAGVMELVDVVDSKASTSNNPSFWRPLDFSRLSRYTSFSNFPSSLHSSLRRGFRQICRCDGIGRRSGFKIRRWRQRVGSSPTTGTKQKRPVSQLRETGRFCLF